MTLTLELSVRVTMAVNAMALACLVSALLVCNILKPFSLFVLLIVTRSFGPVTAAQYILHLQSNREAAVTHTVQ